MRKSVILLAFVTVFMVCLTAGSQTITVVPYPNEVKIKSGNFEITGADFHYSPEFDDATKTVITNFAKQLSLVTGKKSRIDEKVKGKGFLFILDPAMVEETYSLTISHEAAVVKASSLRGVNYAVQTMKQMLPVEIFGKEKASDRKWTLQCVEINDAPRFDYRGFLLDVARNYYTIDDIKKYLDIMEVHKLNKFHWHLTDDQGWRIEIKKYPRLTEFGSIRKESFVGHPSFSNKFDGKPYGGWYSQDQIREVVAYAASKGIDIIPEIDLPGHMQAALASYPELGCTGGPYEVLTRWIVSKDVLCAGNEKIFEFLENVLTEVTELFPYKYIHIGGDECPKDSWKKCPKCQAKIKALGLKDEGRYKAEHYLQSYVMERVNAFLANKGRKVIGWDEILEGEIGKSATIMSWRGTSGGQKAAKLGNDVIMSPNSHTYVDRYLAPEIWTEPVAMGGFVPIERAYGFEPQAGLNDEEKTHILGVQANMWTEYISDTNYLEYMLNPRLAAISEVQWCRPNNKSWERFVSGAEGICRIYEIMGYNYSTHVFEVRGNITANPEKKCLEVALESHGPIRYTLDGSDPTFDSPLYTAPIEIREDCVLKARSERRGKLMKRLYTKSFEFHKASFRPVQILRRHDWSAVGDNYGLLVDGLRSTTGGFWSGDYIGWRQPFEAIIEMDEVPYNTVVLSTVLCQSERVACPLDLVVYTSEDGNEYAEVARLDIPDMSPEDKDGPCEYTVSFPETTAKYLKVKAGRLEQMPDWHLLKGISCSLFVDEVVVR